MLNSIPIPSPKKAGLRTDQDGALLCGGCGEFCTHFRSLHVFMRGEDHDHGLRLDVDMARSQVSTSTRMGDGNPSSRRDGLALTFTCEFCKHITEVTFAQHKGTTFIECA
jgi:hypothetical protein